MLKTRISFERRKNVARQLSEAPHWVYTAMLDAEMKRRLELKDKKKEVAK
jgi:hypothetical protein